MGRRRSDRESRALNDTQIVITGAGAVTPLGPDLPSSWSALCAGEVALRAAGPEFAPGLEDLAIAPARLAEAVAREGFSPRELRRLDPVAIMTLCAAAEAAAQAGTEGEAADGVLLGIGYGATTTHLATSAKIEAGKAARLSPFTIPASMPNAAASELAIRRGLGGPAWTVGTACASGLDALGQAWLMLRAGLCTRVWCGGSEHIDDNWGVGGMAAAKALAKVEEGTVEGDSAPVLRPFDQRRQGTAVGSGAAMFVMETETSAQARGATILARVLGYGASADAHHITAPQPDGDGAARSMQAALASAGLKAEEVVGVFAHGTGTPLNDAMEVAAMAQVFGAGVPPFTSTKGQYGHAMGASGALHAAFALTALAANHIPPTVSCEQPDSTLPHLPVLPGQTIGCTGPVLINAFGFGGHNASFLLAPA